MPENHPKQTQKYAALQRSHRVGSCIQLPRMKENSLDIETQPWETQAAAPLPTASTDTAEKNPQKRFMIGELFDL